MWSEGWAATISFVHEYFVISSHNLSEKSNVLYTRKSIFLACLGRRSVLELETRSITYEQGLRR